MGMVDDGMMGIAYAPPILHEINGHFVGWVEVGWVERSDTHQSIPIFISLSGADDSAYWFALQCRQDVAALQAVNNLN